MALTTYESQVSFLRPHIKSGTVTPYGTWSHGLSWGVLWGGNVGSYRIQFETIGDSPYLKSGSFYVRCTG